MRVLCYYFFNAPHIQKSKKFKLEYYVIIFSMILTNTFSSLLSFPWLHIFLHGASFLKSFFPSPSVPFSVMLDAQPYVETHASACSP